MKNLKNILAAIILLSTLTTSILTASTSNTTDICEAPLNGNFKLIINDVEHEIATPFNLSAVPVTVQIIDNGMVVFECTAQEFLRVVGDGIDHRVVGDGIDHRVVSDIIEHRVVGDGIDHRVHGDTIEHRSRTIEISQGGVLLFEKQL